MVPVPLLSDSDRWFRFYDVKGDGRLSQKEVSDALLATYPIHTHKFEASLPELWSWWDLDRSGHISKREFTAPGALLDCATTIAEKADAPPVRRQPLHRPSFILEESFHLSESSAADQSRDHSPDPSIPGSFALSEDSALAVEAHADELTSMLQMFDDERFALHLQQQSDAMASTQQVFDDAELAFQLQQAEHTELQAIAQRLSWRL